MHSFLEHLVLGILGVDAPTFDLSWLTFIIYLLTLLLAIPMLYLKHLSLALDETQVFLLSFPLSKFFPPQFSVLLSL